MPDAVEVSSLREGDVLLYEGKGIISWAIKFFDGSKVSHAGLYLGERDGKPCVGEALGGKGLIVQGLAKSIDAVKIHVRRLKNGTTNMQPVLEVADSYLDDHERYAYEQIVLLAFLSIARKLEGSGWKRWLISRLLSAAAVVLDWLLNGSKEPMICSEFVYRCYNEADDQGTGCYELDIPDRYPELAKAAAPGEAPAPSNIAAGSLLAAYLASDRSAAPPKAVERKLKAAAPKLQDIEKDLQKDLELFQKSLDKPESTPPEDVSEEELFAGIEQLAGTWHASAHVNDAVAAKAMPSLRELIEEIFGTNPDLVTPAGLLKTKSLKTIGELND